MEEIPVEKGRKIKISNIQLLFEIGNTNLIVLNKNLCSYLS